MKKGLKLFSFLFVVCLLLGTIVAAFVVTNTGTGGFMTRANKQFNCSSLKKGGSIACGAKTNCYWKQNTKTCVNKVAAGSKCFGTIPCTDGYSCTGGTCNLSSDKALKPSKQGGDIGGDPKPVNSTTTSTDQNNVQKIDNVIKTYVPIGWIFHPGFPVTQNATTNIPDCPISQNVSEIGNRNIFHKDFGFYDIKLCKVHGYAINSIKAKDFDNMFTAMKAAGYSFKGDQTNFRTSETQATMNSGNSTGVAKAGGSNHERGLAVDIACSGGGKAFRPWTPGKQRGLADFERAIAEHPCLSWIHNNAKRYRLLLMCDGKGDYGEIAVKTGGCETWHLSPTGH